MELLAKRPQSILEAMWLAKIEEEKEKNKRYSRSSKNTYQGSTAGGNSISAGGFFHKNSNSTTATSSQSAVKKLTPQEMRERREKRLCFYCNEKYTSRHRCKEQKIFNIEIVMEEP